MKIKNNSIKKRERKGLYFFLVFLFVIFLVYGCKFFNPETPAFNNNADAYGHSGFYEIIDLVSAEPEMLWLNDYWINFY